MITVNAIVKCDNCGKEQPALGSELAWQAPIGWIYLGITYTSKGVQREMSTIETWLLCEDRACQRAKLHTYAEMAI